MADQYTHLEQEEQIAELEKTVADLERKLAEAYEKLSAADLERKRLEEKLWEYTKDDHNVEQYYKEGTPPDLTRCPKCGGVADNGHDRGDPPVPYFCTKCEREDA